MGRDRLLQAMIVATLLLAGWMLGRHFLPAPANEATAQFRLWFWEDRSLDLAVQAALILVGALGAAALLPSDREDRP